MIRVLALDPGERVGWATGVIHIPADGRGPSLLVKNHGISFLKDMGLAVLKKAGEYDVIVYETWRLRPNKAKAFIGSDFPSVQFVGMVRLAAWAAGTKLVSQGPSVKSTADKYIAGHLPLIQAKLDGMPSNHDDGHDGDALRHLAFYFHQNYAT